jgi:hypothetical protein
MISPALRSSDEDKGKGRVRGLRLSYHTLELPAKIETSLFVGEVTITHAQQPILLQMSSLML